MIVIRIKLYKIEISVTIVTVEEVPQNTFCISIATENIIMEVPQKILIKTFSATLAYNGISITIFLRQKSQLCDCDPDQIV